MKSLTSHMSFDTGIPLQKVVTDVRGFICEDEYLFSELNNQKQIHYRM